MKLKKTNIIVLTILSAILVLSFFFFFRIDLTSDKRHSIAPQTKQLMRQITEPLEVTVYLDGDLNPGFLRLRKATSELLDELRVYSRKNISVRFENPSLASSPEERMTRYAELEARGMTPTNIYERDREGRRIQKMIFPWVELTYGNRTIAVNILKNIRRNSGEENLNISIENLEFELTDAIRILTNREVNKIAFLEGNGELSEDEVYDISSSLSKYFQIDRGVLGTDATVLNNYKVVIIANPTEPFSEAHKYIIDQYIMHGGRVLWLVDGVRLSREQLSITGSSPIIELDLNLRDMFFRYGARINPVLLQDRQSVMIPMNIAPSGEPPHFEPMPWIYAPLLLTSFGHPVTRNIVEVKSEFPSAIELVGENPQLQGHLLLATSDNTHIVRTPGMIDLRDLENVNNPNHFNTGYVPVAVSLEGVFQSVFTNRMMPREIANALPHRQESKETRQIIVANSSIIRNEIAGNEIIPLGFDRFMNRQFGNKDFIQNAVLYLADRDGWMELRSRTVRLSLLNKRIIEENRTFWQVVNLSLPIVVLLAFGLVYQFVRKRKYV
jgi:ABC-2 type transport system permease protein